MGMAFLSKDNEDHTVVFQHTICPLSTLLSIHFYLTQLMQPIKHHSSTDCPDNKPTKSNMKLYINTRAKKSN